MEMKVRKVTRKVTKKDSDESMLQNLAEKIRLGLLGERKMIDALIASVKKAQDLDVKVSGPVAKSEYEKQVQELKDISARLYRCSLFFES